MGKMMEYKLAMSEFDVLKIMLGKGEGEEIEAIKGASILFTLIGAGKMATEGNMHNVKKGYVCSVAQGVEEKCRAEHGLDVHRAYAEQEMHQSSWK